MVVFCSGCGNNVSVAKDSAQSGGKKVLPPRRQHPHLDHLLRTRFSRAD
jgi:hypothetical protein